MYVSPLARGIARGWGAIAHAPLLMQLTELFPDFFGPFLIRVRAQIVIVCFTVTDAARIVCTVFKQVNVKFTAVTFNHTFRTAVRKNILVSFLTYVKAVIGPGIEVVPVGQGHTAFVQNTAK
jgi:hypothetical protein